MNKKLNNKNTNQIDGLVGASSKLSDFSQINIRSNFLNRGLLFLFVRNRELKPILPNLIKSRLKQKLQQTQLIDLINPFPALTYSRQQEPAYLLLGLINGAYRGA